MRTDVIRLYKTVHTWTGIVAGMALFIAFYAGALTVFKEPLARWLAPPLQAGSGVDAVPLAQAPALVTAALQAHPGAAKGFELHLHAAEHVPARMGWLVRTPGGDEHDRHGGQHYFATLDAQGALQVGEEHPSTLPEFIDVLHRVVGLPVDTDGTRWAMGVVAVLYALALVSGVIVLLPTLVKDFFALRLGKNLKRMWLDAHNVVGIVSLPFHVVMALTAVVFAFHDDIYALQKKFFYDSSLANAFTQPGAQGGGAAQPRDPARMLSPEELLARVRTLSSTFEPTMLQYGNVSSPRAMVRVWGHDAAGGLSPRAAGGFVALEPYSGRILNADYLPGRQSGAFTLLASFFALHFATFGGTPVQWMYFLLGLAGAWLFYGGNLLWVESRRKAQRGSSEAPVQRRSTYWMAAATVGVCLGCVCGISWTLLAGKWLYGRVENLGAWHMGVYYAVFLGSLAWAFLRGGARASVALMWLAAASTLAIPVTSLLAWLAPGTGLWMNTSTAALGVDLTALAGGCGLAWMARLTARRVWHGPADSVWSAHAGRPGRPVAGVADAA